MASHGGLMLESAKMAQASLLGRCLAWMNGWITHSHTSAPHLGRAHVVTRVPLIVSITGELTVKAIRHYSIYKRRLAGCLKGLSGETLALE
jgi:hypothetical protein